jgi:hypothetical protein
MRWMLTGKEFDAAEAHRIGLIQEVLADGASPGLSRRSRSGRHSAPIIGTNQLEPPRLLPLLFWGAHNPLIWHHFLGVFRFAQMGAGRRQKPTHGSIGIKS